MRAGSTTAEDIGASAARARGYDRATLLALGPGARAAAERYVHDDYALTPEHAAWPVSHAVTDTEAGHDRVRAVSEADCDELVPFPWKADPEQVDALAEGAGR